MANLFMKLPIWLVSLSFLVITALFFLVFFNGNASEFCPHSICGKNDKSKNEDYLTAIREKDMQIEDLNDSLSEVNKALIKQFLKSQKQVKDLEDRNLVLSRAFDSKKTQASTVKNVKSRLEEATVRQPDVPKSENQSESHQVINDSYLLPIRQFHQEARCYGSSLNFTIGEEKPECVPKEELASRFLGFLVQLNQYDKAMPKSKDLAKKELIKLQQKYKFSKLGWYSIHVFNILATEIRTKALATQQN